MHLKAIHADGTNPAKFQKLATRFLMIKTYLGGVVSAHRLERVCATN